MRRNFCAGQCLRRTRKTSIRLCSERQLQSTRMIEADPVKQDVFSVRKTPPRFAPEGSSSSRRGRSQVDPSCMECTLSLSSLRGSRRAAGRGPSRSPTRLHNVARRTYRRHQNGPRNDIVHTALGLANPPHTLFDQTNAPLMTSDDQTDVSRRRFLHSLSIAGVVGAGGSLLAACGGGSDGSGDGGASQTQSGDGGAATAQADCSDLSGLSDAQKQQREQMVNSLQYVEESPEANKNCANCSLYQKEKYGAGCGGCTLFPGPVAAEGYCTSWAPKS